MTHLYTTSKADVYHNLTMQECSLQCVVCGAYAVGYMLPVAMVLVCVGALVPNLPEGAG